MTSRVTWRHSWCCWGGWVLRSIVHGAAKWRGSMQVVWWQAMNGGGVHVLRRLGGKLSVCLAVLWIVGIYSRYLQFETLVFGDIFHGVLRPIRDLKGKRRSVLFSEVRILNIGVGDEGFWCCKFYVTWYIPPAIFVWCAPLLQGNLRMWSFL